MKTKKITFVKTMGTGEAITRKVAKRPLQPGYFKGKKVRTTSPEKFGGRVYVPASWIGKTIMVFSPTKKKGNKK